MALLGRSPRKPLEKVEFRCHWACVPLPQPHSEVKGSL